MSNKRQINVPERLESAPGYVSSGVSIFSRNISHHVNAAGLNAPPEHPQRWRTVAELITRNRIELEKIEAKLKGKVGHAARAKLDSDADIKRRFIAKLLTEQADMIRG